MTKYIFITGGVVSSLGKGLAAASLASLLQLYGYRVRLRKFDPYLNIDPGTMSPLQHGEVFVTEDGTETDLDLGHYERFTNVNAHQGDSVTAGKIYSLLLKNERRGDYLGKTVQVIPHVTDLIKEHIMVDTTELDFLLCEIGGTVGDIEGLPFYEAARQLVYSLGKSQVLFIHLTWLPYIPSAGELKTKPTQHSVKELRSIGIQPDILLCRSDRTIPEQERQKIALFCNVDPANVIAAIDVPNIYCAPLALHDNNLAKQALQHFQLDYQKPIDLAYWEAIVHSIHTASHIVNIAIIGKYTYNKDAYKSIYEALHHAAIAHEVKLNIQLFEARDCAIDELISSLAAYDAILIPGAFGSEGVEGKIAAIKYARTNSKPFLGICFGMQLAIIEYARNVLGLTAASSTEFGPTNEPVVALMSEWMKEQEIIKRYNISDLGGTLRLGSYQCHLKADSKIANIYKTRQISERHRHRYEVNKHYQPQFEQNGLIFSGMSPDDMLPEAIELANHPWFIGVQFHPEFKSRPFQAHPLFDSFIEYAVANHKY
jgi:CTP synthase